jgi:hypothetical protein
MRTKVTGWKAVVLIIVVLGLGGYRLASARSSLSDEGTDVLKTWVSTEYQRYYLAQDDLSQDEKARFLIGAAEVEFRSVSARGSGDNIVVRVEIEPSEFQPPGTKLVRYFRMEHSMITGWRHRSDVTAFSYYTKLF